MTLSRFKRNPARRSRAVWATILMALFALGITVTVVGGAQAVSPPTVQLRTAGSFAILSYSGVSDVPSSPIVGDVGVSPTTGASITGLNCAEVTGTIYSVDSSGPLPCRLTNPGLLTTAKNDSGTAYVDAGARTPDTTYLGVDNQLGGSQTLVPGVYRFGAATTANLIGNLTLSGDANSVWIFQATSSLDMASGSTVTLTGGALACNIFWEVGSQATLETGSTFVGTILAGTTIVAQTGVTINGRLLAQTGAVTLDHDTITRSDCSVPPPPEAAPVTTPAPTTTTTATPTTPAVTTTPGFVRLTTFPPPKVATKPAAKKSVLGVTKSATVKKVTVTKKVTATKKKAAAVTHRAHALPARHHAGFTG